jgi:TonB family protein
MKPNIRDIQGWLYLRRIAVLVNLLMLGAAPFDLGPQGHQGFESLAEHTARIVSKSNTQQILIAQREGCLLDQSMCKESESALRSELVRTIPIAQFISSDATLSQVKKSGLLPIDAYNNQILLALASETGATTLVTENLQWEGNHYELNNHVYDASTGKSLGQFALKVAPSISGDDPLVFRDPESGVSLIVPKRKTSDFRVFRYPKCEKCPPPVYLATRAQMIDVEVSLRVTVTDQGEVQQIVVLSAPNKAANDATVAAVRKWHFKPAIDSDGESFAARTDISFDLRETSKSLLGHN